jgi:D-inositol-3-phosphate glycosyltransferase
MPASLHIMTSTSWGGLELYVTTLISTMARSGEHVAAYVSEGSKAEEALRANGVTVYTTKGAGHFSLPDVAAIRRIVRKDKFQIVHSHTRVDVWLGSLALMFDRKRRHINSVYMVVVPKKDPLHRLVYSRVDAIISSSRLTNLKIATHYPVKPERIHLIRYGRDISFYYRDAAVRQELRQRLCIGDDEVIFGMIGRIDEQKGIREFASSFTALTDAEKARTRYVIIGEPTILRTEGDKLIFEPKALEVSNWLKTFAAQKENEGRIILLDFQKDVLPYYTMIDVLVLASYAEMYSLSVIDAMCMCLPVIGTDSEGTPEQVQDGRTGFLVEPKSAKAIGCAVSKYLENPKLLSEHGEAAAEWAHREHAFEKTLDNIQTLYTSLLD